MDKGMFVDFVKSLENYAKASELERFGPVWGGLTNLRKALDMMELEKLSMSTVKECLDLILSGFPDDFTEAAQELSQKRP